MKKILLPLSLISVFSLAQQNTGINTTHPQATLEVASKTENTTNEVEGLLIPRVSKQKALLMAQNQEADQPEESTLIYINDLADFVNPADGTESSVAAITENGYYHWNGIEWVKVVGKEGGEWIYDAESKQVYMKRARDFNDTIAYYFKGDERKIERFSGNVGTIHYDNLPPVAYENIKVSSNVFKDRKATDRSLFSFTNRDYLIKEENLLQDTNRFAGIWSKVFIDNANAKEVTYVRGGGHLASLGYRSSTYDSNNIIAQTEANAGEVVGHTSHADSYSSGTVGKLMGDYSISYNVGTGEVVNQIGSEARAYINASSASRVYGNSIILSVNKGEVKDYTNGIGINNLYSNNSAIQLAKGIDINYSVDESSTIIDQYGIYVNNINNGENKNYAIYTNKGLNSFGDNIKIRNHNWVSNQRTYLEFSNGASHKKNLPTSQIIDEMNGAGDGGSNLVFSTQSPTPGTNPNLSEPTDKMKIGADGKITINGLAGTGDRMLTVNADGVLNASNKSFNDLSSKWQNETNGIVLDSLLVKDHIEYIKEGGSRQLPQTLRAFSMFDRSSNSIRTTPFEIQATDYANTYHLKASYSDAINSKFSGIPYPMRALNKNLIIIDENESDNLKRISSTVNSIQTTSAFGANISAQYGAMNEAEHFGTGKVSNLMGVYNVGTIYNGEAGSVRGAYNQATAYGISKIGSLETNINVLSPRGTGEITYARANRNYIELGYNTGENRNTITNLIGSLVQADIKPSFTGKIENYYAFQTSNLIKDNADPNITNMYGLKLADVNLGSALNYAIYTGKGKNYFGDNLGIGVKNPLAKLETSTGNQDIYNAKFSRDLSQDLSIKNYAEGNMIISHSSITNAKPIVFKSLTNDNFDAVKDGALGYYFEIQDKIVSVIRDNGNMGIGTTTPSAKLEVSGDVKANTFIASTGQAFPDYVFQNYYNGESNLNADYNFKTLNEVEAYIKENGHLPGYVSAAEVAEAGQFDMTATQLTNVEKIEELYLHLLEKEKEVQALKAELKAQNSEIEKQSKLLEAQKADIEAQSARLEKLEQLLLK